MPSPHKKDNLMDLPTEIRQHILSYLTDDKDIAAYARTSKLGLFDANNPLLWKERIIQKFHFDQKKISEIQKPGESFKDLYRRLGYTSFMVFRTTMDKIYDPITYFNTHLQNTLNVNTFKTIFEAERFLRKATLRGARYIVELDLSLSQAANFVTQSATLQDVAKYFRYIHPDKITFGFNYCMPDKTVAKSIAVTFEDGKLIEKNDRVETKIAQLHFRD